MRAWRTLALTLLIGSLGLLSSSCSLVFRARVLLGKSLATDYVAPSAIIDPYLLNYSHQDVTFRGAVGQNAEVFWSIVPIGNAPSAEEIVSAQGAITSGSTSVTARSVFTQTAGGLSGSQNYRVALTYRNPVSGSLSTPVFLDFTTFSSVLSPGVHAAPISYSSAVRPAETTYYRIYLPPGYQNNNKKYPLVIFLMGIGEVGTTPSSLLIHGPARTINDNGGQMVAGIGAEDMIFLVGNQPAHMAPQATDVFLARELLDIVMNDYRIDADRIYATGLSMGATGAEYLSIAYPELIAATAAISADNMRVSGAQCLFTNRIPLWFIHGQTDDGGSGFNLANANAFYSLITACPSPRYPAKYSVIQGRSHNGTFWNEFFSAAGIASWIYLSPGFDSITPGYASIYQWMKEQRKESYPVATFNPLPDSNTWLNDSAITLTFNEPIFLKDPDPKVPTDALVQNLVTLRLGDSGGTIVPASATLSVDRKVITVTPISPLSAGLQYTLNCGPVADEEGNEGPSQTASFTTRFTPTWRALININPSAASNVGGNWNNVQQAPQTATPLISPLIDDSGNTLAGTGIQLSGTVASSSDFSGVNAAGAYPIAATRSHYRSTSNFSVRIFGLNPARRYTVRAFGSFSSGQWDHGSAMWTRYVIGSESRQVAGLQNTTQVAQFNHVSPDGAGNIDLGVQRVLQQGILSAIEVQEQP